MQQVCNRKTQAVHKHPTILQITHINLLSPEIKHSKNDTHFAPTNVDLIQMVINPDKDVHHSDNVDRMVNDNCEEGYLIKAQTPVSPE